MKIIKSLFLTFSLLFVAFGASAGLVQNGTGTLAADPFAPNVVKIERLTGTNDAVIKYADGSSFTLANSWSSYIGGSGKVWQSSDGTNSLQNSANAGLDAGYDAVAVVKNNILNQSGNTGTKCVAYSLSGGNAVTLCTTGYYDSIWSRTSPY